MRPGGAELGQPCLGQGSGGRVESVEICAPSQGRAQILNEVEKVKEGEGHHAWQGLKGKARHYGEREGASGIRGRGGHGSGRG